MSPPAAGGGTGGDRRPVAVVTGANSGVGKEATRHLLRRGWEVAMLCRSRERGEEAHAELEAEGPGRVTLHLADLSRLDEVREVAGALASAHPALDALVNNAGLYVASRELTGDGFERTMAVNHLAHVLLTLGLREPLEAAGGRVVCVASEGHRQGDLERRPVEEILRGEGTKGGLRAYADSKLANVLFARELDRRWREAGVRACAVHPGMLSTRIWDRARKPLNLLMRLFKPFMGSAGEGGDAVAFVAGELDAGEIGGRYFNRREPVAPSDSALDDALARRVWAASVEAVGWDDGDGPDAPDASDA